MLHTNQQKVSFFYVLFHVDLTPQISLDPLADRPQCVNCVSGNAFDATFNFDLRNAYFMPSDPTFQIHVKTKRAANGQPGTQISALFNDIICKT